MRISCCGKATLDTTLWDKHFESSEITDKVLEVEVLLEEYAVSDMIVAQAIQLALS